MRNDDGENISLQVDQYKKQIAQLTNEINKSNFEKKHRQIGTLQLKITSLEQSRNNNTIDWGYIAPAPQY